ncbi:MAG: hypothetical protein ACLQBX_03650 [Candidatus Limnocylindrales bacterium]
MDRMVCDDEGRAVTARSARPPAAEAAPPPLLAQEWRVQLGIFALSAAVSLAASVLLVTRPCVLDVLQGLC